MKWITALAVSFVITLCGVALADQQDDLKQTEAERADAELRARALRAQEQKALNEIADLRPKLIATARAIQNQEDQLTAIEGRLARLDSRRHLIVKELAAGDETLAATLLALTRLSRRPATAALVQPGNLTTKARGAGLMARIVPRIAADTKELTKRLDELRSVARDVALERDAAMTTREALSRHQSQLNDLLFEKQETQKALTQAREAEDQQVAALVKRARSLKDLIAKLDQQEQERVAERAAVTARPKPAGEAGTDPPPSLVRKPESPIPPANGGTSLEALYGHLSLPVRGSIAWRFGQVNRVGQRLRGIEINARPGAWVTTPVDGRVSYAGAFRSYGQILIIDAGDQHHMVLARLGETSSSVGDILLTGEPVGVLPQEEARAAARLYVEMRREGVPIDPLPWFAPDQRRVGR